jgi:uncharacterized protein YkwD
MRVVLMRLRSTRSLVVALAVTLFALAAIGGPSPLPGPATASAAACPGADSPPRRISSKSASHLVVCLVNHQRAKHGLKRVKARGALVGAASRHSKHMQRTDCFDHVCPGEPSLPGRYQKTDYLPCGCNWGAAENIAWGPRSQGSPRAVVEAWMNSSAHRSNILNGSFRDVGVGVRWGSPDKTGARAGTYTLDSRAKCSWLHISLPS